jgi:hypothetical protein
MPGASFATKLKDASVTALATVIVGALTLAGAVATGWLTFAGKDEELKVHLVEIAIGILRADPKEDVAPARGWAIDIIEKDSGVKFSEEDRAALLHKPIKTTFGALPSKWDTDSSLQKLVDALQRGEETQPPKSAPLVPAPKS